MIYLRTGVPGAGKTLNTIKEICKDPATTQKQKFYNNIKAFLLDLDMCNSFQGFFYGIIWPEVNGTKKAKTYLRKIKEIHTQNRLAELTDFPWLSTRYAQYDEAAAIKLFVSWCKRCYPPSNLKALNEYMAESDELTIESLKLLNYHWTLTHDVHKWYELPNGSIGVFDECQDHFPPMANSAKRPTHYTQFEKHRHSGFDIHLITQHYTFLDARIQKTTNLHVHYYQLLGSQRVTRFQKDKQFNTDNSKERDLCVKSQFNRDKSFYGVYWSADEHTAKLQIPAKLVWMVFAVLILIGAVIKLFSNLNARGSQPEELEQQQPKQQVIKPKPKQTETELKEVLYTDTVVHPLSKLCARYEYAGNQVIKTGNVVKVEHMINCVTGETQEKEKTRSTIVDGEQHETSTTITEPVIRLIHQAYLERLGYQIYLIDTMPVLKYSDTKIILNNF